MRCRILIRWKGNITLSEAFDDWPHCPPVHVHTDAELRARDERIIRATMNYTWENCYSPIGPTEDTAAAIIAAAEADRD